MDGEFTTMPYAAWISGFAGLFMCLSPAFAGTCETWAASRSVEEEGPTLTASVCALGHHDDVLNVSCGGEGKLRLTYVPAVGDDYPPGGDMNYKAIFEFHAGQRIAMVTLRYEAMDGILAAHLFRNNDVFELLKGMSPVTVTDTTGHIGRRTFGVRNSAFAIGKIERGCYN